jgi:tripartite-type tricarboxylate transporter receptor subunit TctC
MVVTPDQPVKTLAEFLALARANPGKLNFSSAGVTSTTFLAAEVMRQAANIQMVHVPFKGVPEALTAVIRGDVALYFAPVPDTIELTEAGKVRPIATNSAKRLVQLPDIPTIAESGLPDYKYEAWFGMMAPAQTPKDIVAKINKDVTAFLTTPEVVAKLLKQGSVAAPTTPAEFDAIIKADAETFTKVLAAAGVKAN